MRGTEDFGLVRLSVLGVRSVLGGPEDFLLLRFVFRSPFGRWRIWVFSTVAVLVLVSSSSSSSSSLVAVKGVAKVVVQAVVEGHLEGVPCGKLQQVVPRKKCQRRRDVKRDMRV